MDPERLRAEREVGRRPPTSNFTMDAQIGQQLFQRGQLGRMFNIVQLVIPTSQIILNKDKLSITQRLKER